jgi:hypothetical protein
MASGDGSVAQAVFDAQSKGVLAGLIKIEKVISDLTLKFSKEV